MISSFQKWCINGVVQYVTFRTLFSFFNSAKFSRRSSRRWLYPQPLLLLRRTPQRGRAAVWLNSHQPKDIVVVLLSRMNVHVRLLCGRQLSYLWGKSPGQWLLGCVVSMRRAWPPPPVFLPGESHGQSSLAGNSPWGRKESDATEVTACVHATRSYH